MAYIDHAPWAAHPLSGYALERHVKLTLALYDVSTFSNDLSILQNIIQHMLICDLHWLYMFFDEHTYM